LLHKFKQAELYEDFFVSSSADETCLHTDIHDLRIMSQFYAFSAKNTNYDVISRKQTLPTKDG